MPEKQIITQIDGREVFMNLLKNNPGLVIIKFNAEWCGPCKKIKNIVHGFFATSPDQVVCADLDVDTEGNIDVYGYLQTKKMVSGIPAILCYKKKDPVKEQITFIPDDSISGANPVELDAFFKRTGKHLDDLRMRGLLRS